MQQLHLLPLRARVRIKVTRSEMGWSALCSRRSFNLDAHPRSPCWDEHTRPLSSSSWASWSLASSDSAFKGGNKQVRRILWEPRDGSDANRTPRHRSSDVRGCPGDPIGGHTSYGSALSRAGRARQKRRQSCTTPGQIFWIFGTTRCRDISPKRDGAVPFLPKHSGQSRAKESGL